MTDARFAPPRAAVEPGTSPDAAVRLHRLTAIGIAVFFGGALAGGYLVFRNSLLLGRRRDAVIAAVLFGALFAATQVAQLRWSHADYLGHQLTVGLPRLVIALLLAAALQHRFLRAHKRAGHSFRSRWIGFAVGVGLLVAWDGTWIAYRLIFSTWPA